MFGRGLTGAPRSLIALFVAFLGAPGGWAGDAGAWCGTEPLGSRHFLALHGYARALSGARTAALAPADLDADHVAIVEDRGDLVIRKNPFDLAGMAVRLIPNRAGGYDAAPLPLPMEAPGSLLGLGEDEARDVELAFEFPFYGIRYRRVFVHSDGHVTFGSPDAGPGERGLGRFLAGPPRIAGFFTDLDPSRGGTVSARLQADRAVFVWEGVPGAGQINRNTFAVVLHADGGVDVVYGAQMQTREGVAGVSPGSALGLTPADLSEGTPRGASGALAERFSESEKLDLVSVTRRFLAVHADVFQQIVVYTGRPLNPLAGTLAFQVNVKNEVRGIGLAVSDDSRAWGSSGALESVVYMDSVDQYLDVDGFEILGHEVGHRWLARLLVRNGSASSAVLLGRGNVHWSFFKDSGASVLEGNRIEERGSDRFETVDFARGFSPLDQYTMGLRPPSEVPPFFYVEAPDDFRPNRAYKASSAPEAGVSFTGTRREVRIDDIVAAMGPRVPAAAPSPVFRQAFILVSDAAAPATEARLRAMARIRTRFEAYFRGATDGRGRVDTTLLP